MNSYERSDAKTFKQIKIRIAASQKRQHLQNYIKGPTWKVVLQLREDDFTCYRNQKMILRKLYLAACMHLPQLRH